MSKELSQLLLDDEDHKDYELIINDGKLKVSIPVHKVVLQVNSDFFKKIIGGPYRMYYMWHVPTGMIAAAIRIVKYFYTHDPAYLGDPQHTRTLACELKLPKIYAIASTQYLEETRPVTRSMKRKQYIKT